MEKIIILFAVLFIGLIVGLITRNPVILLDVFLWTFRLVGYLLACFIIAVAIILQELYFPDQRVMIIPIAIGSFIAYGVVFMALDNLIVWIRNTVEARREARNCG